MHGQVGSIYNVADLVVDPLPQPAATSTLLGGRYLSNFGFCQTTTTKCISCMFWSSTFEGKTPHSCVIPIPSDLPHYEQTYMVYICMQVTLPHAFVCTFIVQQFGPQSSETTASPKLFKPTDLTPEGHVWLIDFVLFLTNEVFSHTLNNVIV